MQALLTHLATLGVVNVSMLWVVDGQQQLATFQPLDVSKLKAKKTILGLQKKWLAVPQFVLCLDVLATWCSCVV